jgi:hypothetical protein
MKVAQYVCLILLSLIPVCLVSALVQRRRSRCFPCRFAAEQDALPSSLDDAVLPADACDEPGDVRSPGVSLRQVRTIPASCVDQGDYVMACAHRNTVTFDLKY